MGVYIKGVGKEELIEILRYENVFDVIHVTSEFIEVKEPHGDLIDRERIDYKNYKMHDGRGHLVIPDTFADGVTWVHNCIYETPTVIEAEGE